MRPFTRSPVTQFALSGLLAMVIIGVLAVAVGRRSGREEAIREAKQVSRLAARGIVAPSLTEPVIAGDPAALRRLDMIVRRRVLHDGVVRVKIWSRDGRVVYSDARQLIGRRMAMDADEAAVMTDNRVEAQLSDLSRPENAFERSYDKLLEVYFPVRAANGDRLLFETYQRFSSVSASGRRLWLTFAPALLGGLALLQIVNLPLARSLARRLREGQQEREALLRRALDASQTERRAIAADLHDGVVQNLVGLSYGLEAHATRINGHGEPAVSTALRRGAAQARDSVRALRSLLIDIYPPSLQEAGLPQALEDLATTYDARGLRTAIEAPADLHASVGTERLLFRCAQEALRNAHKHSGAREADLTVHVDGERLCLRVADNGRGFDPAGVADHLASGHIGLRVLRDLVEDAGGRIETRSKAGSGTVIEVQVPR